MPIKYKDYDQWSKIDGARSAMSKVVDAIKEGIPQNVDAALKAAEKVVKTNPVALKMADGMTLPEFAEQVRSESGQTQVLTTGGPENTVDFGMVEHKLKKAAGEPLGISTARTGRVRGED